MAADDGTIFVPILPSFDKFFDGVEKNSGEAGERAGKAFSDALENNLDKAQKARDKLFDKADVAAAKAAKAAEDVKLQEQRLAETMEKSNVKASEIMAARNRLADANRKFEKATKDAAKASEAAADADTQVRKAQDELNDSLSQSVEKTSLFGGKLGDLAKTAGAAVVGFASFTAIKDIVWDVGSAFDDMYDTIRVGTGASGEAFEGLQVSAQKVADSVPAMDGGLEQIGATLADLNTRLGVTGEPLEQLTSQFIQLQNMGIDADINDVSGAMQQFGVAAADMPTQMDELFQISQATGRSITDITASLSKSGPALQQFGFSLTESAGFLGLLDKAGLNSEQMMTNLTKALGNFAKEGKEPQEALWGTFKRLEELTAAGKDLEAVDLANSIFGAKGGAGFVEAVKQGQFNFDEFMSHVGASGDTIAGVAGETADFAESWQLFKQKAMLAIEPVASQIFGALAPALEQVAPHLTTAAAKAGEFGAKLGEVVGWVQANQEWLVPLAVTVGTFAGVIGGVALAQNAWNAALGVYRTVVSIAQGQTVLFNATLLANPIVLIVASLAALTAGLVYFFTQTETGRAVWAAFTSALATGWEWVKGVLSVGWEWLKQVFINDFQFKIALIKGAWEFFTTSAKVAWDILSAGLSAVWGWLKLTVFDGFVNAAHWVNQQWISITTAIKFTWDVLTNALKAAWDWVKASVFDAFNNTINGVKFVFGAAVDGIKAAWEGWRVAINAAWVWVRDNVFHNLKVGLEHVKQSFKVAVDGIGKAWDRIRELTAKPVRFVVDTVYNHGIRGAWNKVAKFVGLDELPEFKAGFATGGVLPGYSPGRDNMMFYSPRFGHLGLSGGEAIMRPEWTRAVGGPAAVEAMNDTARKQGERGVRRMLGEGAAFARGGVIPNGGTKDKDELSSRIAGLFNALKGEHGKPYQYGGTGNPSWDCSGLWSGIVQYLNGGNLRGGRIFNTESNFGSFGFVPGLSGRVTIGVLSGKGGGVNGHMAGTIDGTNLESAGDHGVQIGGAARGSDHSMFNHQYTLQQFLGEFISGGGGGGGFNLSAVVKGLWDKAIEKIGSFPGADKLGLIGKLPAAMTKTLAGKAWDFVKSKIGFFSGSAGTAGNAESWREMAMAAMRRNGFNADDPRQVDAMLKQIQSESGGNPGIAQQIVDINGTGENAGVGLLQIIPGTFAANRDPELPNDRRDPWANMNAALRYYRRRYGTDLTTMWGRGHGYDSGGWLKPTPGGFGSYFNHTGKPEAVLTAEQWSHIAKLVRNVGTLGTDLRAAANEFVAAARGGDEGYGATGYLLGNDELAKQLVNRVGLIPDAVEELKVAFHGGDFGYGALEHLLGDGPLARALADKAALLGTVAQEFQEAAKGGDWGYGATAELLGGNGPLAQALVNGYGLISQSVEEVKTAFDGGDWGYGALERLLGGNSALAKTIVNSAAVVGQAGRDFHATVARAQDGFNKWAAQDENRGRVGTPEEWAAHFGAQAGAGVLDDALGLFGLDGIVGGTLKDSFVELVNQSANYTNAGLDQAGVGGVRFGHIHKDILKPINLIDDQGRVPKVEVPKVETPDVATATATAAPAATSAASAEPSVERRDGKQIVVKLVPDGNYTGSQVKKMLEELQIQVEELKEGQNAPVTSGVGGIV